MNTVLNEGQKQTVVANLALVEHIVNRMAAGLPASHSRDDLVQSGIMGLISATMRFDPDNGTAFSTFAGRRIEGAIIDMLRQTDWAPRSVRLLERRLADLTSEKGAASKQGAASTKGAASTPTNASSFERLCQDLGVRGDQIERLRGNIAQARIDSLDRPVNGDGTVIPLSATVTDPATQIEDTLDNQEMVGYLRDGVTLLPERHRIVVIGYFFEGRSMTELGTLLGVTQSRASQLKDEAIKMLRSGLDQVYHDRESPEAVPSTGRQKAFNDALATSRPWRQRITAGQGFSAIAPDDRVPDDRVPADRVNVRT